MFTAFMEYGSVFATIIFLFEILLAFVAFGFEHSPIQATYVVDVGIVGTQLFMIQSTSLSRYDFWEFFDFGG